jgi:hypothetical protein
MRIKRNLVEFNEAEIHRAVISYARELHEKEFGHTSVIAKVKMYRETVYSEPIEEKVLAEVAFTKRREMMPSWARELRERLKPLYKGKGELYYNRRKDYIGVKLYCPRGPIDLAQAEQIVRGVCEKHEKFVTVLNGGWLFHVWNNIPAHLQKSVLEDKP